MRVLITGARGQVGQSLRERIPEDWEVIFTDSKTLDITNEQSVQAMVQGFQPDVIINTAAYTNVDQAETNTELAFAVNAHGVGHLAKAAESTNAYLIHLSTDHVFNGKHTQPITENDAPNPINVYGKSKLAGELLALNNSSTSLIIRTSWVYGEYGNNFVKSILKAGLNNSVVDVLNNQTCNPTYSGDLADVILKCAQQIDKPRGIYHFTSGKKMTRLEFIQAIFQSASKHNNQYANIQLNIIESFPLAIALRPEYSVLSNNKIQSLLIDSNIHTELAEVILKKIL